MMLISQKKQSKPQLKWLTDIYMKERIQINQLIYLMPHEAEQEEELVLEEGQLTAQLHHYLPSYWFKALENKKSSMRQQQIEEWDRKVVQSFNELTRSELREDECITEVRKIVDSFRLWRVA